MSKVLGLVGDNVVTLYHLRDGGIAIVLTDDHTGDGVYIRGEELPLLVELIESGRTAEEE